MIPSPFREFRDCDRPSWVSDLRIIKQSMENVNTDPKDALSIEELESITGGDSSNYADSDWNYGVSYTTTLPNSTPTDFTKLS